MSFKDLTARVAAAMKLKPAKINAQQTKPKAAGKEAPAKSKTS